MAQEIVEVPIPGKILSVNVSAGDVVEEGAMLCSIESMKMENPILAPVNGKVIEIKVTSGQFVRSGDTVAVIDY